MVSKMERAFVRTPGGEPLPLRVVSNVPSIAPQRGKRLRAWFQNERTRKSPLFKILESPGLPNGLSVICRRSS